ncbi:hypothetical protein V3W47_02115 [Deinococcus sp. YIM 134068]|uniref:hypothetical protein n=1 Tax=Deinococcus lichenicola TaxID=3118910 RepID=UPI002F9481F5
MTDDGSLATGGMTGITEDTPGHAGAPGEAGSIEGISAFGDDTETPEEGDTPPDLPGTPLDPEGGHEEGLITDGRGGVTGTSDL